MEIITHVMSQDISL